MPHPAVPPCTSQHVADTAAAAKAKLLVVPATAAHFECSMPSPAALCRWQLQAELYIAALSCCSLLPAAAAQV
jgi:hypothetical protein